MGVERITARTALSWYPAFTFVTPQKGKDNDKVEKKDPGYKDKDGPQDKNSKKNCRTVHRGGGKEGDTETICDGDDKRDAGDKHP